MNAVQSPTKPIADLYPLAPMQQGMLFHSLLSPEAGIYLPQVDLSLAGDLDAIALKQAWQTVIAQHPVLRTGFQWEKHEQPFQVVYHQAELPWQELDWRNLPADPQRLDRFLASDRQRGFDLKKPPLMRLTLIRTSDTQYHLIWTQHHLILDGWSAGLVLSDVFQTYQGEALPSRRPYRDYIAWRQQRSQTDPKNESKKESQIETFWRTQMQGFTAPTLLPIRQADPPSEETQPDWAEQCLSLTGDQTQALQSFAKQHQLTLNTVVQGAFAILLSRYTDQTDVCFGATISGRPATLSGADAMIGLFINTIPVRLQVPGDRPLVPWLQALQTQQLEAMQQDCSLLDLQAWCDLPPGTPLFESIVVFENYPIDASLLQLNQAQSSQTSDRPIQITQVRPIEWTSLPMTLLVSSSDRLTFQLKFDRHLFTEAAIARLLIHLQTLLQSFTTHANACLGNLSLLPVAELQQLQQWSQGSEVEHFNNHLQPVDADLSIADLFEAQVERTPDAIALLYEDQQYTYRDLNCQANQLAHHLQSLGAQPETVVALHLERSPQLVIALLATLKTGATYLPLDPSYPGDRLAQMLVDSGAGIVLGEGEEFKIQNSKFKIRDSELGIQNSKFKIQNSEFELQDAMTVFLPLSLSTSETNLRRSVSYHFSLLYTSGSTGTPKGVLNTQRGIVNRLRWMQAEYGLGEGDRVLQKTPYSFDVSIWEFFWTLLTGASLVLAKPDGHRDSRYLVDLINQTQVTTIHFVPSMLQAFLEEPNLDCPSLKQIFCSGEALPVEVAQRCCQQLSAQIYNLYGPTEAAIDVSYFPVTPEGELKDEIVHGMPSLSAVPIGRAIAHTQLYVLDRHLNPVPIGVPGELYIGGVGVASGYYGRADLTAERFIPNPFGGSVESRLYKTGDLVRYRADGVIEYLGRIDNQVKLRGFRIELGEIESLLRQHPAIANAVVMLHPTPTPQLIAYVTLQRAMLDDQSPDPDPLAPVLSTFLARYLPAHMLPAQFITLDTLPLLPNGKLNRSALPAPDRPPRRLTLPRCPTEKAIAAIWAEVLKLESVSIHDSLFEVGGNSLVATRINSRLRQAFELDLPLRLLFEKPTIAELAERITTLQLAQQQALKAMHRGSQVTPLDFQPTIQTTVSAGRKEIEL